MAAVEEDEFEKAMLNVTDEDDAAFAETIAANLSPDDIDDFCTTTSDGMVVETLQAYGAVNGSKASTRGTAARRNRTRLAGQLDVLRQARSSQVIAEWCAYRGQQ